jgi:drug/metabolite transporter (DMT)-like permease
VAVSRWVDVGLFGALATLWGLSFPAISVGLDYLPPLLFAALRYDVAAVLLLGYAVVRVDGWRPTGSDDRTAVVGGGLFLVAGNGLLFVGQQTVPSGVAAILQALVPIATALWALALLGERLSAVGAVGVALGFLGIGLVVQPDPANLLAGDTIARLLIVGQVCSVALGGVLVQRAGSSLGRVPLTGWSMLLGAVVLHLVSLGFGEVPGGGATTPTAVGAVVYLGVFSTAIAFFIYFTILEEHGAFQAALVAYLVPVVATLVSVFVLEEPLGTYAVAGFAVVAVGFALLKRQAIADVLGATPGIARP